ncbi:MAG TPA: ribonuclease III domain-containing protein [Candidatus Glassbacteria bacterium]|nr:ribonuclease III domain-containing protein [Candidatus Glassbacteria bacterium]
MSNWDANIQELQEKIEYTFKDSTILQRALTAVSYANDHGLKNSEHQEAYSTLGDAVQDVIVMNQAVLCGRTKKGYVTSSKSIFAEQEAQAQIAKGINLLKYVRLGGSEVFSIASKVFSRCFESLLGAIFIDGI